jgi:hypothetical protein
MIVIGYVLIAGAVAYLLYKLYLAYDSMGGTDMMVAVNDGAMFPPVVGVLGLYILHSSYEISWPAWLYFAVWFGVSVAAFALIKIMVRLGDKQP